MFDYTPMILKLWVQCTLKSLKILSFFIVLEFLTIWTECMNSINRLLKVYTKDNILQHTDSGESKLNNLDPLYYLQKLIISDSNKISDCTDLTSCSLDNSLTLFIVALVIIPIVFHHVWAYFAFHSQGREDNSSNPEEGSNSRLSEMLNIGLVNILDFSFKNLSIFLYYIFLNKIFVNAYYNTDVLYIVISAVFLILYTFFYFYKVNYIMLLMKLDSRDSLHYDSFSQNYDQLLFILKILITINKNLIFTNSSNSYVKHIISLDYLILFFLFNFTIKMCLNIVKSKNLILVTNLRLNCLRFFLTIYLCVNIVIFYFFNLLSIYQLIVTNTSVILISICIITYLNNEIFTILYKDDKIIYQLTFLLNLFLVGEEENTQFEKEIIKIKSLHDAICKKKLDDKNCIICDQSEIRITQNSMEEDKINLMQSMFRYVEENVTHSLLEEEVDFFNFMNLIFNYSLTQKDSSIPPFKFIYKAKELIEKNKEEKKNCYYYNLVLYYNKINCQSDVNLKKFKIVKNYDSSLLGLKKSIDIVKEIVMTIESKVKKDLYPQTNELNKQKKFIMKNLEEIHSLKNVTNDTFSFVMCKYIFEKTFNIDSNTESKILGDSDDFDLRQDFVEDRFCKDSIIIVKYNVHEDSLIITRATKKFVPYQGKYLEEVFPKRFRILGKQMFIHEIHKNNEGFEFEFLSDDQNDFVKTMKFDCKIFRAPDLQEIFIFIHFEISKEDLVVFETPKVFDAITSSVNHEMNKSFLSAMSNHLEKILFINPRLIDFLPSAKLPKKTILLTDIFRKMNLAKNGEDGRSRDITGTDFLLSYKSYYSNFFSEIERSQQLLEDEDVNRRINQVKHMVNANISLNIRLNLKFMINKNEDCDYCVFSFKNFTTKKMNIGGELNAEERVLLDAILGDDNKKGSEDPSDDSEKAQEHFENEFKSGQTANSSGASVNGSQKANILADITINGKKSTLGTSENRMAKFTITTLAINICLGIYCIIFLVIGFSSNKKMQELDSLKTYFNVFERFFYQTALSQFYNVGVYTEKTNDMSDYIINSYWNKFAGSGLTMNMGDYANNELYVKTDLLKEKVLSLQNFIYGSSYADVLSPVFSFQTNHKVLTKTDNNDMKISTLNPSFFETIIMFMNNAKASIFYTTNTMIYIHNYDLNTGNYDFSSIWDRNISDVQKAVYEAIWNFPNFVNNLNKIWGDVITLFDAEVNNIFNLNLYMSLILIGLHFFLLFISLAIIKFLKTTTLDSNIIFAKVVTGEWSNYLVLKLNYLKDMLQFYKVDPLKASNKIRREQRDNTRLKKEQSEKSNKSFEPNGGDLSNSYDAEISIENLTAPLIRVLVYLFSFYLIYASAFIVIFNSAQSDIMKTSEYSAKYLQNDKAIMNSILLLQCIIFSNQTDLSLLNYLKNYTVFYSDPNYERGFVWDLIEESKVDRISLYKLEDQYPRFKEINDQASIASGCDYLYTNINDDVFAITKSLYPGNTLLDNLKILCKQYAVTDLKSFKDLVEEINFIGAKMIRSYLNSFGDYSLMKKTNDETEFFDEFTIAVMIIRPIQTYILNNYITQLTNSSEDNFVLCVIIFMIGNLLVECIIFFVINRKLIRRVLVINEEIKCLTLCITA
jgi:hypothetical protein